MKNLFTINKSDILYTSIFHYTYFDKTYGNTYRIVEAIITLKNNRLIRTYSPYGYGYGDALNEIVNDLCNHNDVFTSRDIKELLKTGSTIKIECKLKECKQISRILEGDGVLLKDIKFIN